MTDYQFPDFYEQQRQQVNQALQRWLPETNSNTPRLLLESIRYSVFGGGKRFRGVLVLEAARLGEPPGGDSLADLASAVEMIHAYSLIHDDLPAMDDDDFRRGQPSNHREYGEDIAILTGDALLTRAFEVIGELADILGETRTVRILREISRDGGGEGLIGGQVLDLTVDPDSISPEELQRIHRMKTGALIRTSLVVGGIAGDLSDQQLKLLETFGVELGLAFQVKDDLLEVDGELERLGKDPDSDANSGKRTYPGLLGIDRSREVLEELNQSLSQSLNQLDAPTDRLRKLVELVVNRDH